jgi:hypothetical protein
MRMIKLASAIVTVAIVAAGCGSSNSTGAAATGSSASTTSAASAAVASGGSCKVDVTGDATASWQTAQDKSTLLVSYWLSAKSRESLSLTGEALILNCKGSGGSVNFITPAKTSAADFPKSPKKYVLPVGGYLGGAEPGEISMVTSIDGKSYKIVEAGSFDVTTFGGSKFVGTFSVKVGRYGDDNKTIVARATMTGSFDLSCTGDACS